MGLILVNTGEGKGKTTAALGAALRMSGHGRKVLIIQFVKAHSGAGEYAAIGALCPLISILPKGLGFVPRPSAPEFQAHREAACEAMASAANALESGEFALVVLDELNYAVTLGLVAIDDVLTMLQRRCPEVHVMVTGRYAHERLVDIADTVTEMRCVKHAFDSGVCAQEGIEF